MPDTLYVAHYEYLHSPFSFCCGIHTTLIQNLVMILLLKLFKQLLNI